MRKHILATLALALFFVGCTADQLSTFATDHPKLAPATQKVEIALEHVDSSVAKVQTGIELAKPYIATGQALGVPYSDVAMGALGLLSGLLAEYGRRRHKALTQTVNGLAQVDLTTEQKAALASAQDVSTKALITKIKGG